ncbi:MAG TPA: hypothetical protein VHE81_13885, partial [Lacipirellulaceae bacterium]|nr:hypothetical protein [Lacipirellulaceae bacterium]
MGFLDRFKKKGETPPPEQGAKPAQEHAPEGTVRVGPGEKTVIVADRPTVAAAPPTVATPVATPPAVSPAAKAPAPTPAEPAAKPSPPEPETPAPAPAEPPKKTGFFAKIREGLKKTTRILNTDIRDLFKSEGRLVDDAFLDELLEILIKT